MAVDAFIPDALAQLTAMGLTVDVTVGSTTVKGLLDNEPLEFEGPDMPGVNVGRLVVHVQAGLAGLIDGAALTVAGTAYRALSVSPYSDGAMVRVVLTK